MRTKEFLLRIIGCFIVLGALIGCGKTQEITLPGFSYLSDTIALDVADVVVVSTADPSQEVSNPLMPVSIRQTLEDWANKRFVAAGKKGKALITIKEVHTVSGGLKKAEDIHVLFNSDKPDYFGAKALVTIEVIGTESYSKGEAQAFLERRVEIESDVKLGFRRRLWQQFVQTFMNALDDQMMLNLATYLPKILVE